MALSLVDPSSHALQVIVDQLIRDPQNVYNTAKRAYSYIKPLWDYEKKVYHHDFVRPALSNKARPAAAPRRSTRPAMRSRYGRGRRHGFARAGKRRFGGRHRRVKKGRGRGRGGGWKRPPSAVTRGGYSARSYGRKDRGYYQPTMGRLKLSKLRHGPGDKFRVCLLEKLTMPTPFTNQRLEFFQFASSFVYLRSDGVSNRPNCPELFRVIGEYGSWTITGMKMEVWTQPIMDTAAQNWEWQGGAYSLTGESDNEILVGTTLPVQTFTDYVNLQDATRDPSFRREKFGVGTSATHLPARKKVFSRYVRFPRNKEVLRGYNTIVRAADPVTTLPAVTMKQLDQEIAYICDNVTTAGCNIAYEQVATLYFKCFDRRDVTNLEIPLYLKARKEIEDTVQYRAMPVDPTT